MLMRDNAVTYSSTSSVLTRLPRVDCAVLAFFVVCSAEDESLAA